VSIRYAKPEAFPAREGVVVAPFNFWRRGQGAEPVDHLSNRPLGRSDRHHIAGADDDELHIIAKGDVLREQDGSRRFGYGRRSSGHRINWIYANTSLLAPDSEHSPVSIALGLPKIIDLAKLSQAGDGP